MSLTPIIQPKPYLDLGTLIHKSLAYWTANPDSDLNHVFTAIAVQHKQNVISKYSAATGHDPSDEEMEPLLDAIVMGISMASNYQEYYGKPLPDHLSFCAPEQEILIPIPGTEFNCCILQGSPLCESCGDTGIGRHYLKARLDALAQDEHGNVYVVERKTYDKRPDLALLEVSDQFIGYVWAAQQLNIGPIAGIAYDGLWKRANPPQRPKKLEIADLFVRTMIVPSQDEVDEYGRELAITAKEMANPNTPIYKNRQWSGCWDCSFEYLCRMQSQNGDVQTIIETQYTRRTEDDVQDIAKAVEEAV